MIAIFSVQKLLKTTQGTISQAVFPALLRKIARVEIRFSRRGYLIFNTSSLTYSLFGPILGLYFNYTFICGWLEVARDVCCGLYIESWR